MRDPLYDQTDQNGKADMPKLDYYLIAAQRAYGICSQPDCDRPIMLWCTRCHAKTCANHARVVQLLPDYHPATLCYQCQQQARKDHEIDEDPDPAVITIRRPDYDPHEEEMSEGHAAWWLTLSVQRYIRLVKTDAPDLLRDRELHLIEQRTQQLYEAGARAEAKAEARADDEP